mmetsp:Transcript_16429/g.35461  ORF Transcript_16429/g.35461 Transcript_16429/m.35461 type:complete len:401 (-) Transcript_16429:94-1296(-)|eukprot:CAMPEP_0206465046 /NCGR_PEP_ID=MMETSP0324_2-20121206/27587_1 /ASSEMBLY_ACC=CAM_ASM_000836 /TAXON_ID=2866 /ORGANISM="Crypthecodinium cohnii, Strain Seligo" /LENGTH=400 /DNA_ID=CAMNT_0053937811 /DNA_START=70 /DNA_END=1272 /DNA_ORIENTATION=-
MSVVEEGVTYPREVPQEGLPPGWKAIEKAYGSSSKSAGKTYIRFFSDDGSHSSVLTMARVFELHCQDNGGDPAAMLENYKKLMAEKRERMAEQSRKDREARGIMKGENREAAIQRFRDRFGQLTGAWAFQFPGWRTRWHFQPNCNQTMIEYLDPEGNSFKLLKDVECALQLRMEASPEAETELSEMIKQAEADIDKDEFAKGSRGARDCLGVFELTNNKRGSKPPAEDFEPAAKRQKTSDILFKADAAKQEDWAVVDSESSVKKAFTEYQKLLQERGFSEDAVLLGIYGLNAKRSFSRRIQGIYLEMPGKICGERFYQKLLHHPGENMGLGCDSLYLVWSDLRKRWEMASHPSDERRPVVGHGPECEKGELISPTGPWKVNDEQGTLSDEPDMKFLFTGS